MNFDAWLDTLVAEKGIDVDGTIFVKEGMQWGENHIPLEIVLERIKQTTGNEQAQIKNTLVEIDFRNGDIMHYFDYLAGALAL